ncbi:MAG: hypothetical protein H7842_11815 [Gammaproteobacteria bacterium SHHR-1]
MIEEWKVLFNAPFDLGFLNAEFQAIDGHFGVLDDRFSVIDVWELARPRFPREHCSLNVLGERLGIQRDRSSKGVLSDCAMMADAHLAITSDTCCTSIPKCVK